MRYMLLICSDDKNAPPEPRAEMEAIIRGQALGGFYLIEGGFVEVRPIWHM